MIQEKASKIVTSVDRWTFDHSVLDLAQVIYGHVLC